MTSSQVKSTTQQGLLNHYQARGGRWVAQGREKDKKRIYDVHRDPQSGID